MKDIGGANAILPVAMEFAGQYGVLDPILYADGVSFDRFKNEYPLIWAACNPSRTLGFMRPRVVVTTTCSPGGVVPMELVIAANEMWIPVVVVQDYWGNHLKHEMWGDLGQSPEYLPDVICVQDDFARNLVLATWPHMPEHGVIVTGQPAYDRLKRIDCQNARYHLRQTLGLTEDWPVIHFSGQIWGMPEAVRATIDAFNLVGKPVYLVMRDHPRLFASNAPLEFREIFAAYRDIPGELRQGKVVHSSSVMPGTPVDTGADVVVSMYSGALVEACYLRKDSVCVWVPETQAALATETHDALSDFPPAALGACLRGTNADELAACFERIFSGDTVEMRAAQEQHFVSDGQSARRVADVIRRLA